MIESLLLHVHQYQAFSRSFPEVPESLKKEGGWYRYSKWPYFPDVSLLSASLLWKWWSLYPWGLSLLRIYNATPFWSAEFILKNQRINLWISGDFRVYHVLPFLTVLIFSLLSFGHVSQCVPPWVHLLWATLRILDLSVPFLTLGRFSAITSSGVFSGRFCLLLLAPYRVRVGVFNTPEVSETALFPSIVFSSVCSLTVILTIVSSYSFFMPHLSCLDSF